MNYENTDPSWKTHIETLTKRMKQIEIGDNVKQAISDWYYENGMIEPQWYMKEQDWWIQYLQSLDNDNKPL
jgi:hypothetical protein